VVGSNSRVCASYPGGQRPNVYDGGEKIAKRVGPSAVLRVRGVPRDAVYLLELPLGDWCLGFGSPSPRHVPADRDVAKGRPASLAIQSRVRGSTRSSIHRYAARRGRDHGRLQASSDEGGFSLRGH